MAKKSKSLKKKVLKHVKKDMENFKHEIDEDKKLIKSISKKTDESKSKKKNSKRSVKKKKKIEKVMREYKEGELHSGSETGPRVKNPKQAIAIALSEARRMGKKRKRKK